MRTRNHALVFREIYFERPFEMAAVQAFALNLATLSRHAVIWEIRAHFREIHYFIGADKAEIARLDNLLRTHFKLTFGQSVGVGDRNRKAVQMSRKIILSRPFLALKTEPNENFTRALFSALTTLKSGDEVIFQLIIGQAMRPQLAPKDLADPSATWWQYLTGKIPTLPSAQEQMIREKLANYRLNAALRLGVYSPDLMDTKEDEMRVKNRARTYLMTALAALRMLETAGNHFFATLDDPQKLNVAKSPWRFPLKLSVLEVATLLNLPTGESEFPGLSPLHPKLLLPPKTYLEPTNDKRIFGADLNPNPVSRKMLSLPAKQALKHCQIIGATGCGKSVVMENLILSDIQNGRGCVVIDPKFSLVQAICEKLPKNRLDDVIILDPNSARPVGFNPFAKSENTSLRAESMLATFRGLVPEFGVYTEEILTAGLLTLAKNPGSTLLDLPLLFTNDVFREKAIQCVSGDIYLANFWQIFAKRSDKFKTVELAPLLRRLNVLLMCPGLVGLLGQSEPKFDLNDIFAKNKILLVPLNSGLIGKTAAEIVANLLISQLWDCALKRAELPEISRQPVILYIDEFQNFVKRSSADMEEMLSMARGLGVGFCFAHQNLEQLPKELRATILTNARSQIIFGTSKNDAAILAENSRKELDPLDMMSLERFHFYAKLETENGNTGFISGQSFPPKMSVRHAAEVFAGSAGKYGRELSEIQEKIREKLAANETSMKEPFSDETELKIGRKNRKKSENREKNSPTKPPSSDATADLSTDHSLP